MNLFIKIPNIKVVTVLIVALLFFPQIFPWQATQSILPQKLPKCSINNYVFVLTLNTGLNFLNNNRQYPGIKLSTHHFYDKFDITPTADITNYKKIYQGRLSLLHRYNSFLTAQFSTST